MLSFTYGNYRSSVPTHCTDPSSATWQRQPVEPASPQRNSVCGRARLQVAGIAASLWQLAHGLYPDEPVVEERGARPSIRIPATRADSAYQARSGFDGQHHRQGPSRWYGCVKKNGPQSIGKSRGGWTTKIHMVAADARACLQTMARGQNLPDFTICARPPTLVWGLAVILRSCLKRLIEITFGVCKHALEQP